MVLSILPYFSPFVVLRATRSWPFSRVEFGHVPVNESSIPLVSTAYLILHSRIRGPGATFDGLGDAIAQLSQDSQQGVHFSPHISDSMVRRLSRLYPRSSTSIGRDSAATSLVSFASFL